MIQIVKPYGSSKKKKILGRGRSSGKGKTCGKGHKGLKARAGGTVNSGFEGGQISLIRRVPKFGFKNMPHKKKYFEISFDRFVKGAELLAVNGNAITIQILKDHKIIPKTCSAVKILSSKNKEFSTQLRFKTGEKIFWTKKNEAFFQK